MPSILTLFLVPCPVPSQPDGEPVENLNKGDEAEPKAKTKESSHVGNKVNGCHSQGSFKF